MSFFDHHIVFINFIILSHKFYIYLFEYFHQFTFKDFCSRGTDVPTYLHSTEQLLLLVIKGSEYKAIVVTCYIYQQNVINFNWFIIIIIIISLIISRFPISCYSLFILCINEFPLIFAHSITQLGSQIK